MLRSHFSRILAPRFCFTFSTFVLAGDAGICDSNSQLRSLCRFALKLYLSYRPEQNARVESPKAVINLFEGTILFNLRALMKAFLCTSFNFRKTVIGVSSLIGACYSLQWIACYLISIVFLIIEPDQIMLQFCQFCFSG